MKYFKGESGVYYQQTNNRIVIIKAIYPYLIFNKRTRQIERIPKYNLEYDDLELKATAIIATKTLIRIGEL